jgi:hypothetical protein
LRAMRLKDLARDLTPPIIVRGAKRALGIDRQPQPPPAPPPLDDWRKAEYQGVRTAHNARPLHVGRFAEAFERHYRLDPWHLDPNVLRYRVYNLCRLAELCRDVPGDFVVCGVSWGVAPRVIYDYLDFASLGKTFHFVDPFTGIDSMSGGGVVAKYNADPDYVRRQYPADAPVRIHRVAIPAGLPLAGAERFAFVYLNTSDGEAEARSLAYFLERLGRGGWMTIDLWAICGGHFDVYESALAQLGAEPIWFPSGQGAITKR